uniref:Uncharacterized protein n=1 Tax=Cacopsylla melanoneura TaxID=428564 RepID=A0A8D8V154_9HEMI
MYVTRSFVNTASLRQNPNRDSLAVSHIYLTGLSHISHRHPDIPTNTLKPIKILLRDSEDASTSIQATQQQSQSPSTNTTGFTCPSVVRPLLQVQGWSHKSHEGSIVQRRSSKPDNIAPMNVQLHVCVHYYDVPRRTYLGLKGRYDHIGLMNILPSCFSYVQIQIRG